MDYFQTTQDGCTVSGEAAGYSLADNRALQGFSGKQSCISQSQLLVNMQAYGKDDKGMRYYQENQLSLLKTYHFFLLIENEKLIKIVSLTGNDLETSGLLYSAMFCTNQKNAFLFRKSSVLIPNCQSYSSEKQRKSNIFSLLYICCPSCGRNPKALPLLIPCRSILYLSLPVGGAVCWQVCPYACLPAGRSVGKQARWQDGRQAGWSAGRLAGQRVYVHTYFHSCKLTFSQACKHSCGYNHSLTPSHPLILVLLLGSLGIGKRCFESRNNSTNSNPFAGGFLISRESSKVSFELPEGFSVTAEKWQQQGMFRVTRNLSGYSESLTAGLPSEVGQPVFRIF